jgi:hypothetical protein
MSHVLDPKRLSNDRDYCAALDELDELSQIDAGSPGGWRFDELAALIHEYEATMRSPGVSWPLSWPVISA